MGNSVSAAENVASTLIHPVGEPKSAGYHHNELFRQNAEPPPECPMHQKKTMVVEAPKDECPVGYGKNDLNPLNMVSVLFVYRIVHKLMFFFLL